MGVQRQQAVQEPPVSLVLFGLMSIAAPLPFTQAVVLGTGMTSRDGASCVKSGLSLISAAYTGGPKMCSGEKRGGAGGRGQDGGGGGGEEGGGWGEASLK